MAKLYTVKEVAQALNFSTNTIYKFLDQDKIKATRLSTEGRFRIPEEEVLRLLQLKGGSSRIASIIDSEPSTPQTPAFKHPKISAEPLEKINLRSNLKPRSRIPEFLTLSATLFLILVALGVRNIQIFTISLTKSSQPISTPAVLSETQEVTPMDGLEVNPEATPEAKLEKSPETQLEATPEAKLKTILIVQTNDTSTIINIRQKPNINSEKIGQVKDGDTLELISIVSNWYEIKMNTGLTGFISEKFVVLKENKQ